MSKRTTKADRVAAEKAALRYELELLAIGAHGCANVEDEPQSEICIFSTLGCKNWARWLDAIRSRWNIGVMDEKAQDDRAWIFLPHNMPEFESLDKATEFLYGYCGARAGGKWNA